MLDECCRHWNHASVGHHLLDRYVNTIFYFITRKLKTRHIFLGLDLFFGIIILAGAQNQTDLEKCGPRPENSSLSYQHDPIDFSNVTFDCANAPETYEAGPEHYYRYG